MSDKKEDLAPDDPVHPLSEQLPEEVRAAIEPESSLQSTPSENMEVHHHSHTHGKKNWKSYIWEFLMLFLAVFCGFLAEYQLEHKIEDDRAKELARSFYEELLSDSVTAQTKIQNRIRHEEALAYLSKYYRDSSLTEVSKTFALNFEYGINFRTPSQFEPRTIVLEQLKNSGSLRYFKNEEMQKLIGDITVIIRNIYDRQALETETRLEYINPLIIQQYDYEFDTNIRALGSNIFEAIIAYEKSDVIIPFHLNSVESINRQYVVNVLHFFNINLVASTRGNFIEKYVDVNAALLKLLREEYHCGQGQSPISK
ncbi:MAG: hypothetical protein JNM00_13320 [Flavobacteriales bacterium]|nr:hypothetical protein [Flavobacteriales bacterium]